MTRVSEPTFDCLNGLGFRAPFLCTSLERAIASLERLTGPVAMDERGASVERQEACMAVAMKVLFETVDDMDANGFSGYFTPGGRLRFGNAPVVAGRGEIASSIEGFFGAIRGLRHTIVDLWELGDVVICEVEADYTRLDGTEVTLPATTIARCDGDLIADYRIYMNVTPVLA